MNITNCRVFLLEEAQGAVKALASVEIDGDFLVTGIRVIAGAKGDFISMPQRKTADGEYKDIAFPLTKEAREVISGIVLDCYLAEVAEKVLGSEPKPAPKVAPAKPAQAARPGKFAGKK